ncbi:hypothetical protein RRF57_002942 [Xylaria bambusicola]|uniref:DUF1754-domain-containing protein n=1 Tax=Xylaria bambusicola TaxID=326684 RepID=A0AAN7Z2A1_9PEZI
MPVDEYVSAGTGGALKLKGAKIQKAKKQKKSKSKDKDKSASLERALSGTPAAETLLETRDIEDVEKAGEHAPEPDSEPEYKTEAERRHEEAVKKKVSHACAHIHARSLVSLPPRPPDGPGQLEVRNADIKRTSQMQRMLEDPVLASEIRKTHKERVESLNTYLSKLSEHHDMPKIGPG